MDVQCRFIFRAPDLDLGRLATAFALLRLPRMPELPGGGADLAHFAPSSVDPGTVKARSPAPPNIMLITWLASGHARFCQENSAAAVCCHGGA